MPNRRGDARGLRRLEQGPKTPREVIGGLEVMERGDAFHVAPKGRIVGRDDPDVALQRGTAASRNAHLKLSVPRAMTPRPLTSSRTRGSPG
jgi:hypothetical protein